MSSQRPLHRATPLVLALQSALLALMACPLASHADDGDDVAALVRPTNSIQVGIGDSSKGSPKAGEYDGLYRKGGDFIGSVDLYGGDGWGQGSGTLRLRLRGLDLGTSSRSLEASAVDQGSWRLGLGIDSLRHEFTNSYQTPQVGRMGGNSFVMPTGFGVVDTASSASPYGTQNLTATQKSFFHTEDVHSDRHTLTISGGMDLGPQWNFRAAFSHVQQDGAKLMSFSSDGNILAPGNTLAGYTPGKEAIQLMMNPTKYQTDTFTASLNWTTSNAYATVSVLGSHFKDEFREVTFSNPYTSLAATPNGTLLGVAFPVDAMSTMPDSMLSQLSLTGGATLAARTHLAGSFSVSDNTQDTPYVNLDQMQAGGLPRSSLGGRVITKHADLRLTDRTVDRLTLSGGLKYNERANHTASATYDFMDLGVGAESSVNIPMSNRRTQLELAADYRVTAGQTLHLGYDHDKFDRWCENAAANTAQGELSSTNTGYYTTASCAQVPHTTENKGSAGYRLALGEDVHLNLGASISQRDATVNPSFYNPMQANDEGFENFGYVAFFQASRRETTARAGIDWQATESLSFNAGAKYLKDGYTDSPLGVQRAKGASADLDATYALGDKASVSAFAAWQHRSRSLITANGRNAVAPLANLWANELADNATTVGLSAHHAGLMGGRLDLKGDFVHSLARSSYETALYYTAASCTGPSNAGYSCGAVPPIRSVMSQVKLSGEYRLDKRQSLTLGYQYQKLDAADALYNFYQMGTTGTTTMPTSQALPSYSQNRVFVVYGYRFL